MRKYLLALPFLLAACQSTTTSHPQVTAAELRAEEAEQQRAVNQIQAEGGKPKHWKQRPDMRGQFERVGERLEQAGADVCRALGVPKKEKAFSRQKRGCYYYLEMSRSPDINASADGNRIVVDSGMMRFIENDDELAAVLGHEMAHNIMGHIDAKEENAVAGALIGMAVDVMMESEGYATKGAYGKTGEAAGALGYSVSFEEEADYVGLYIMARAGYDIGKAAYFWRRMAIEFPDEIYVETTHPTTAARFVALKKTVEEIQYKRAHRLPLVPELKKS